MICCNWVYQMKSFGGIVLKSGQVTILMTPVEDEIKKADLFIVILK